ncbi:Armadillo repeat-containing protein 8 [Physocladia obscura]|uniref:Armadillo repeat-containing protein 8 n=1 Tax=Physocladia obscura TaxID=109957 RepID=A0AAD5SXF5_9FUNG|nr:Armadillo repeat-containing protein 8 [Physocladia obscura]
MTDLQAMGEIGIVENLLVSGRNPSDVFKRLKLAQTSIVQSIVQQETSDTAGVLENDSLFLLKNASVWEYYGQSLVSDLHLNAQNSIPDFEKQGNIEEVIQKHSIRAEKLFLNGDQSTAQQAIEIAKNIAPCESNFHSSRIWMHIDRKITFLKSLYRCEYPSTILLHFKSYTELAELRIDWKFDARFLEALMFLKFGDANKDRNVTSAAIPLILSALTLSKAYGQDRFVRNAAVGLAKFYLCSNMPDSAIDALNPVFGAILVHSNALERGAATFLLAKCLAKPTNTKKLSVDKIVENFDTAFAAFESVQCFHEMSQVMEEKARFLHGCGPEYYDQRNAAAAKFRWIEDQKKKHSAKWKIVLDRLSAAADDATRTQILREVKNAVIGNRGKKLFFVSSPPLLQCLAQILDPESRANVELRIQAACVAGSLAWVIESVPTYAGEFAKLIPLLAHASTSAESSLSLVEASLRALKTAITSSPNAVQANSVGINNFVLINSLVQKLDSPLQQQQQSQSSTPEYSPTQFSTTTKLMQQKVRLCELAASILCDLSLFGNTQVEIVAAGALPKLLSLLDNSLVQYHKMQESALDAIGCIVRGNANAARSFVGMFVHGTTGEERSVAVLLRFLKEGRYAMTRLLAAACLSNLYRIVNLENQRIPSQLLLPTLIKLFSDTSALSTDLALIERSPLVFAELVGESEPLQKLALEGDAISKLAEILLSIEVRGSIGSTAYVSNLEEGESDGAKAKTVLLGKSKNDLVAQKNALSNYTTVSSKTYEKVAESCLLAISSVCSLREDCRKNVIDAKLLPVIVAALSSVSPGIRSAACKCTRSLSRSVKNLRTSLVDAGVAYPLFTLLSDDSVQVQTSASATLCNIVLDFSPMKKTVIENGGVEKLVGLVGSVDYNVRLNAIWALKNLLYQAGSDIKAKVMQEMGWDRLKQLIFDPHIGIQEQALNLLRNLVCGKEDDIDTVFYGFGEAALSVMFDKKLSDHSCVSSDHDGIILQTMYIIVNIAIGSERHKGLIIGSDSILENIMKYMNHEKPLIRLAAVWCVINLTEPDESHPKPTSDRLDRLRSIGIQDALKRICLDSDRDVRDRVRTALKNLGEVNTRLANNLMDLDEDAVGLGSSEMEEMQDLSSYLSGGH